MTNSLIPFGDSVGSLPIFEDARREIAEAETTDRIKHILATAAGLAAAARKAINRELEAEANVLKLEAERKLGQLLQAHKQTVGFNKGGGDQRSYHRDSKKSGDLPTLTQRARGRPLSSRENAREPAHSRGR